MNCAAEGIFQVTEWNGIHAGLRDFSKKNREQDSGKVVELNS